MEVAGPLIRQSCRHNNDLSPVTISVLHKQSMPNTPLNNVSRNPKINFYSRKGTS